MKITTLYEITIATRGVYEWTGLFLWPPTIQDVDAAIICDIKSLSGQDESMDDDESMDAEDMEEASWHIERLQDIQQIANHVDAEFLNHHVLEDVTVASIAIGTILVTAKKTYDTGLPAETTDFPERYCRNRE